MMFCERCGWPVNIMHGKVYWQDPNDATMFHRCKTDKISNTFYGIVQNILDYNEPKYEDQWTFADMSTEIFHKMKGVYRDASLKTSQYGVIL